MAANFLRLRLWLPALALLMAATQLMAAVQIKDVRLWQGPESSRLVFDLSHQIRHRLFFLSNPDRVVIDLTNTKLQANVPKSFKPPLAQMRLAMPEKNLTRMVIELSQESRVSSFLLPPQEKYGHRLVVDITPKAATATPIVPKVETNRNVLIAIDAGHGGDDYGAIASGVNEKTLVLAYAKALAQEINSRYGLEALLIREGDYFIPLHQRMQKARRHQADFFVSIHANSFPADKQINGFILFALSQHGASSETARWLAQSENRSNLSGGINNLLESEVADQSLRRVILDLSITSVINQSIIAGRKILASVGEVTRLHNKEVETANFVVLRAPDVPALLLELGFISSPKEAKKLKKSAFRQRMIVAIANGIEAFFYDYPAYGSKLAKIRADKLSNPEIFYTVQSGDTLSQIALAHKVPEKSLHQLNQLETDRILVGQKLRLREDPSPLSRSTKPVNQQSEYLVQPGDSLWTIATNFGLTVEQLIRLNKLNKKFIRPGQKLLLYR